jgi:hypothetical protein
LAGFSIPIPETKIAFRPSIVKLVLQLRYNLDRWDLIKELVQEHGYSIKNANPLTYMSINRLNIKELNNANSREVIYDILHFNPILTTFQLAS